MANVDVYSNPEPKKSENKRASYLMKEVWQDAFHEGKNITSL